MFYNPDKYMDLIVGFLNELLDRYELVDAAYKLPDTERNRDLVEKAIIWDEGKESIHQCEARPFDYVEGEELEVPNILVCGYIKHLCEERQKVNALFEKPVED